QGQLTPSNKGFPQSRVNSHSLDIIPQIYKPHLSSSPTDLTTSEDACHRCGRNVRRECFWNLAMQPGELTVIAAMKAFDYTIIISNSIQYGRD
uniref:Uncharacterized protein n=1 Tax=Anolis carolinensis TaxID=28377 RepID=A0A803TUV8_ANOCA